jgi:phospholipid/cholesterol/gamma-HCH transport system permease protein
MARPSMTCDQSDETALLRFAGALVAHEVHLIEQDVNGFETDKSRVELDLQAVETLDTAGAWLLTTLQRRLTENGQQVTISGGAPERTGMLDTVAPFQMHAEAPEAPEKSILSWLENLGKRTAGVGTDALRVLEFLGLTLHRLARSLVMPWRIRRAALFTQMEEAGFNAIPIVALMGFLIGVVLAFQGAAQLRQFGAEVFVVDLISISILRELGVLLTAIIVAGRSGSAFTAAIGSMKAQEEIDALRTLGLDPIEVLVVPRTLALLIMLPILAMIANLAGLIGGALMSWIDLGVSPGLFFSRLQENTDIWHLLVGLIKAPFFAATIGVISCYQAMQVRGSSQSLGARTTASVVQAIFAVILIDAVFSIFFAEVGV